jgi:hypothetical protein
MKTLTLAVGFILLVFCSSVLAIDPESPTQETTPPELQRSQPEGAPQPFPEQMITGMVTGTDDKPIGGVAVKLFANGHLVETTHTTSAGDYQVALPLRVEQDETVDLWFVDTSGSYPPQYILIKEGSKAAAAALFSKCTREVKMRPQMRVDVRLMTVQELAASYKTSGCL